MFVVHIPLAALLNVYWGYIGIFIATAIANIVIGTIALVWSRRVLLREIKLRLENESTTSLEVDNTR